MAMFTLFEINGDHLGDLDNEAVGRALAAVIRTPSNVDTLEWIGLHRAIRYIGQSGNSILDRSGVNHGFAWLLNPQPTFDMYIRAVRMYYGIDAYTWEHLPSPVRTTLAKRYDETKGE